MVTFLLRIKKSKICRYVNIVIILLFIMLCMVVIQKPSKLSEPFVKPFEYVVKYDLKLLMANISAEVPNLESLDSKYLLDTVKCKLPNLDIFNSDVAPFYERYEYRKCHEKPLLTFISKENNVATLNVDYRSVFYYGDSVHCCYAGISRASSLKEPDSNFVLTGCKPFTSSVQVKNEAVYVECTNENKEIVYKNIHAVITLHNHHAQEKPTHHLIRKPFNILFIGLDSVSRLNFKRSLTKTHRYVQHHNWVQFKAHNKVGLNTYPNLMAVLTGRNETSAFSDCNPRIVGCLNKCNFIWNDYHSFNYVTAYAEDEANMDTFNYLKKGFQEKPVDFYFRPYVLATEELLETYKLNGLLYCTGPETAGERILNTAKEFTTTFGKNHSYFGFFWMNSFTHNNFNGGSRMDEVLLRFFKDFGEAGGFDNTFVMFMSDHGFRFGAYTYTHSGWLEERLPFFYMHVPQTFQDAFPAQHRRLLQNANRLTSHYDLYMTLQDILALTFQEYVTQPSSGCPSCKSLFQEIPPDRSCQQAGVESVWCSCNTYFTVPSEHTLVKEAVKFLLDDVHKIINEDQQCSLFNLTRIVSARISEGYKGGDANLNYLLVTFEVEPKAVLQGTVSINMSNEWPNFKLEGSVGRVDYYGYHSWCTNDPVLQKYCYCTDKMKMLFTILEAVGSKIKNFFIYGVS